MDTLYDNLQWNMPFYYLLSDDGTNALLLIEYGKHDRMSLPWLSYIIWQKQCDATPLSI